MNEILGQRVTDKITGFSGIAIGYVHYLTGCNQVLIAPGLDKDGKLQDGHWIDEQRLDIDTHHQRIVLDNSKAPGFDKPAPARR